MTEEGLVLKATTEYASKYLKSVEEEYEVKYGFSINFAASHGLRQAKKCL